MITINAEHFTPRLFLYRNSSADPVELYAITYAPNLCFVEDEAKKALSEGSYNRTGVFPVILGIRSIKSQLCPAYPRSLLHRLQIGPEDLVGYRALEAYAVVDGVVLGRNTIALNDIQVAAPSAVETGSNDGRKLLAYDGDNPWRIDPTAYDGNNPWRSQPHAGVRH